MKLGATLPRADNPAPIVSDIMLSYAAIAYCANGLLGPNRLAAI
jgi:hypothetical protein